LPQKQVISRYFAFLSVATSGMLKGTKRDSFTYENSVLRGNPGGVAERLIAPVLKTGGPKGLVSSNLTPSAT
jgi:hypothetical protein